MPLLIRAALIGGGGGLYAPEFREMQPGLIQLVLTVLVF